MNLLIYQCHYVIIDPRQSHLLKMFASLARVAMKKPSLICPVAISARNLCVIKPTIVTHQPSAMMVRATSSRGFFTAPKSANIGYTSTNTGWFNLNNLLRSSSIFGMTSVRFMSSSASDQKTSHTVNDPVVPSEAVKSGIVIPANKIAIMKKVAIITTCVIGGATIASLGAMYCFMALLSGNPSSFVALLLYMYGCVFMLIMGILKFLVMISPLLLLIGAITLFVLFK